MRIVRILVLLALTLPFTSTDRLYAVTWDTLTTYYTGSCPNGLTYNGYKWRECDGTITQSGTLSGTWRCDDTYDCIDGTFNYHWYEWCNGAWRYRYTSPDVNRFPESTDCTCT